MTTTWHGVTLDDRSALMLNEVETLLGITLTPLQGSYSTADPTSAGTHSGGGAIDLSITGIDPDALESAMRMVGWAFWIRTTAEGFTPHGHGIAVGCPDLSPEAAYQVDEYLAGRNGLASRAPDDGPRHWVGRTWEDYLAGNPGTGGAAVFRGYQIGVEDVVVTAGSISRTPVILGIRGRADGTTITLTAGDEFYLYLEAVATVAGDVYSAENWRLLLTGHGALDLAESFDPDYSYDPPFTWTTLPPVTVDTDTAALTATPSLNHTPVQLDGSTGAVLLRVTCTTGTVVLDWAVLQVEPPAGLLITSTSHWSPWLTPALVPHAPAGVDTWEATGSGSNEGEDWDQDEATAGVQVAEFSAVNALALADWVELTTTDYPDSALPADVSALAEMDAYAEKFDPDPGETDDSRAGVDLRLAFTLLRWGSWPDWREEPPNLFSEQLYREVASDVDGPIYEFVDGATVSEQWTPVQALAGYEEVFGSGPDSSFGDILTAGPPPGTGRPSGSVWATYAQYDYYPIPLTILPTAGDFTLAVDSTYMAAGQGISPPTVNVFGGVGWTGGPVQLTTVIQRIWKVRADVTVDLRMPDFRYMVNEWVRSPDALDTSDPEGGVIVYLRNRQRDDGLGGWSTPRAKGTSSRQLSLHNRGYE